jgi:hypothetical protein
MFRGKTTAAVVALASVLTVVALVRGPLRVPLEAAFAATPSDGYRYTRSSGTTLFGRDGRYQILVHFNREIWIGSDGSGRLVQRRFDPQYFGPNDRAEWNDAPFDERTDEIYPAGTLNYITLGELPRSARELRAALVRQVDPKLPIASELFTQTRNDLLETVAPPDLALAFRDVLAAEPGIVNEMHGPNQVFRLIQGDPPEIELLIELDPNGMFVHEERTLLISAPPIDANPPVSVGVTDFLESKVVQGLSTP